MIIDLKNYSIFIPTANIFGFFESKRDKMDYGLFLQGNTIVEITLLPREVAKALKGLGFKIEKQNKKVKNENWRVN